MLWKIYLAKDFQEYWETFYMSDSVIQFYEKLKV